MYRIYVSVNLTRFSRTDEAQALLLLEIKLLDKVHQQPFRM